MYLGTLSGNTYTTGVITSNCSVSATYIPTYTPPNTDIQVGNSGAKATIQSAYNTAGNDDTIQIQSGTYQQNLNLNGKVLVTLIGGYDSNYSANTSYSVITGTVIISGGPVIVENIIIQ